MPNLPEIDTPFLLDFLTRLLNTPSPTGLAEPAIALTEETFKPFKGLKLSRTRKGALLATWTGERDDAPRALTAHADTLGGDGQGGQVQRAAETVPDRRLPLEHHRRRRLHRLHPLRAAGARLHPADQGLQPRLRQGGGGDEAQRGQSRGPAGCPHPIRAGDARPGHRRRRLRGFRPARGDQCRFRPLAPPG